MQRDEPTPPPRQRDQHTPPPRLADPSAGSSRGQDDEPSVAHPPPAILTPRGLTPSQGQAPDTPSRGQVPENRTPSDDMVSPPAILTPRGLLAQGLMTGGTVGERPNSQDEIRPSIQLRLAGHQAQGGTDLYSSLRTSQDSLPSSAQPTFNPFNEQQTVGTWAPPPLPARGRLCFGESTVRDDKHGVLYGAGGSSFPGLIWSRRVWRDRALSSSAAGGFYMKRDFN